MLKFHELLKDKEFLDRLVAEINKTAEPNSIPYSISRPLPDLYRYCSLSSHAVEDIVNDQLTVSAVRIFNDMFDSGIFIYSSDEELNALAEKDIESLRGLESYGISVDHFYEHSLRHFKEEAEIKRTTVDFLGAHLCCFSTTYSSILLWAHYARENKGICIRYETDASKSPLFNQYTFPVVYRQEPIKVPDLLYGEKTYDYQIELAVMLSVLCKNKDWKYENEWRLISPHMPDNSGEARYQLHNLTCVKEIIIGYHFLRNFFGKEEDVAEAKENANRLLDYLKNKDIELSVMLPMTGKFELYKKQIDPDKFARFIHKNFDGKPEQEKFYQVLQKLFLQEVCGMKD